MLPGTSVRLLGASVRRGAAVAVVASALGLGPMLGAPPGQAGPIPLRTHLAEWIDEGFSGYGRVGLLDDGERLGPWRVVFDGSNDGPSVQVSGGVLRLRPQPARSPGQTFAALVVSRQEFDAEALHVSATWVTRAHTRTGKPNPWEVGWLVWDYEDNDNFTYLALKPNGWEVGRRDPEFPGGQRFIADGTSPRTRLGVVRTATVDRIGTQATVRIDGTVLASFEVGASETSGAVGMYCEDSVVDWLAISVSTGAGEPSPRAPAGHPDYGNRGPGRGASVASSAATVTDGSSHESQAGGNGHGARGSGCLRHGDGPCVGRRNGVGYHSDPQRVVLRE